MSWSRGHTLVRQYSVLFLLSNVHGVFLISLNIFLKNNIFCLLSSSEDFQKHFHFGSVEDEQSCKYEERSLAKMYFEGQAYICSNIYMFSCFYEIFPIH